MYIICAGARHWLTCQVIGEGSDGSVQRCMYKDIFSFGLGSQWAASGLVIVGRTGILDDPLDLHNLGLPESKRQGHGPTEGSQDHQQKVRQKFEATSRLNRPMCEETQQVVEQSTLHEWIMV